MDYLNGNLQRDKDGQIEDEKARQNVEKIKEAGWFAIIGIIGGPVLIVLVLVGPILILGAMAVGAIYLLGCSIFKK